jgi:hypothetical protein
MKKSIFCILFLLISVHLSAQTSADSLLNDLSVEEKPALLPDKMLITQRLFWGQNGIYRKLHIAPKLTPENRAKEMKIRRTMFKIHQAVGILTAVGMIAQGIVGSKLYKGDYNIKEAHENLATGINITYATTALMAFTAPPPLINRKGFNNIKLHKILAYTHLTGMIATNVLSKKITENPDLKPIHRAVAFTTFGAYTMAIVSIKFEF